MSIKPESQTKPSNVRVAVINTLITIQNGQSLSGLLDPLLNGLAGEDKGFAHALLLTTLRHWHATARLLDSLADNPIEEIAVRTTIQVGMTQLLYMNVADHAAINETVESVKYIELARASGLVNAILRKVAKNPNKFRKKCNKNHSLPNWLAQQLKVCWREQYSELTQSLRQSAPMFLRVNGLQADTDSYIAALQEAEIVVEKQGLQSAIQLADAESQAVIVEQEVLNLVDSIPVSQLLEFEEGIASVQDAHAQLAAPIIHTVLSQSMAASQLTESAPRQLRLLDACAAPGGKLSHWLELLGAAESSQTGLFHVEQNIDKVKLVAIDNAASRNTRVFENLERLQLPAPIVNSKLYVDIECVDATTWQAKSEEKASETHGFDAILLDAPCTATGVIRRHPDIALLREEEDVQHTVRLQEQILDNLWQQLNHGGYFLYVTCSILKAENVEQMQAFLSRHEDSVAVNFDNERTNWGIPQEIGRQCLPVDSQGGDGFYYALLQKVVTENG